MARSNTKGGSLLSEVSDEVGYENVRLGGIVAHGG